MDRRQHKTRAAIFSAFTELVGEKHYGKITVQDIIDKANVGRTTFYAHFETKDFLLKELCEELFGHIVNTAMDRAHSHGLMNINCDEQKSVFCHLMHHLQENDRNILGLLSCESSDIFLRYFKDSLSDMITEQFLKRGRTVNSNLPQDFLVNHISGSFVEMVLWWIKGGMKQTPEELDVYFRAVTEPII